VSEEGAFLKNTDALKDYVEWAKANGTLPQHQVTPVAFGRMVSRRYGPTRKTTVSGKQVRGWRNVKLTLEAVSEDAEVESALWPKAAGHRA